MDEIRRKCPSILRECTTIDIHHLADATKATTAELQRSINARKLTRFGASQSPVAEEHEIAQQHIQHYADALPLGTALASTELQPADDLAILAANVLVNIWDQTKKEEYLYAVTTLLEYALLKSPQSFYMRLVLIRVYRILGKHCNHIATANLTTARCPNCGIGTLSVTEH